MAKDKKAHFIAGIVIALLVFWITNEPLIGFAAACIVGVLKELRDSFGHGQVEFADFAWTCAGGAVVTWALYLKALQ